MIIFASKTGLAMKTISINDALSKAFKRKTVARDDIENFRSCLYTYLTSVDDSGKEAKMEGYQRDFMRNTFYKDYDVTKPDDNNIDCAIRLNRSADSPIAVIIENKAPENTSEMIKRGVSGGKSMSVVRSPCRAAAGSVGRGSITAATLRRVVPTPYTNPRLTLLTQR